MDRRSFFKVMAVAGSALAAPNIVLAAPEQEVVGKQVGGLKEYVTYRLDYDAWQISHSFRANENCWFEASRLSTFRPDESILKMLREESSFAIAKAMNKHGLLHGVV